ncbi:MAG TPA: HEAT repeat domain-containing protein [Pyrinomonadaceae bacterium]|nr:HEAT repeat domain-containing protein [Pyrinomonadaceae bacterium]
MDRSELDMDQRIRTQMMELRQAEEEQRRRIDAANRRRGRAQGSGIEVKTDDPAEGAQPAVEDAPVECRTEPGAIEASGAEAYQWAHDSLMNPTAVHTEELPLLAAQIPSEHVSLLDDNPSVGLQKDRQSPAEAADLAPPVEAPHRAFDIYDRLNSESSSVRVSALTEIARMGGQDAFRRISEAFDDSVLEVRNAAARALYDYHTDRAASFTRALRQGTPDRRRRIGAAISTSGLASEALSNLTGISREKTYDAFTVLFLMVKTGEVQWLVQVIQEHSNIEVRLAVIKLLALSGQTEIVPNFRRLAVDASVPAGVRSAVIEAIHQLNSQRSENSPSTPVLG